MLAPVYCLISAESRHTAIKMEGLRVVADDMEIIPDLSRELRHRDAALLSIGSVSLEKFTSEAPSICIAFENGIVYSEIISAVA